MSGPEIANIIIFSILILLSVFEIGRRKGINDMKKLMRGKRNVARFKY